MLIGEVSKKYNIGVETLRYYDRIGLLKVGRIKNLRHYTEKDIKKLENILAMKEMMFTLDDIKRLLEIDERIEKGLVEKAVDRGDISTLLKGVRLKHIEILQKEKQLKIVRNQLENIMNKLENFEGRDNCD